MCSHQGTNTITSCCRVSGINIVRIIECIVFGTESACRVVVVAVVVVVVHWTGWIDHREIVATGGGGGAPHQASCIETRRI